MSFATIMLCGNPLSFYMEPVGGAAKRAKQLIDAGLYTEMHQVSTDLTGEDAADEMFDLTNNPSRQAEREARYGRHRSLSVGDMVKTSDGCWVCLACGWENIWENISK
jgi:hypothetical protein